MSCLNLKANDSLRLNSTKPKLYKNFVGIDLGGPGLIYSVNYKRGFNLKQKITNYGVIGLVYGDFVSNSDYIGVPARIESNLNLNKLIAFTAQFAIFPLINFNVYPRNNALRKAQIKARYNNGQYITRRIELFSANLSIGVSLQTKKIDFQIMPMLVYYKGSFYDRYRFAFWGQFGTYFKI